MALGYASAASTLDLHGFNTTLAGLSRPDNVAVSVTNNGTADSALTISSPDNSTFPGTIVDGATNSVSIVKDGSSTLLLTGNNTYSGTTTVTGGVLGGPAASLRTPPFRTARLSPRPSTSMLRVPAR